LIYINHKILLKIRRVNGKSVAGYTLPEMRNLLRQRNKGIGFLVYQEGEEKTLKADLKALNYNSD